MTKKEAADQLAIIVAEMRLALDASDPDCPTWPDQLLVIADALDPSGFANEPKAVSRIDTRYKDDAVTTPEAEPYRYIVLERGKRTGVVFDRQTGKEATHQIPLKTARSLVFDLNHGRGNSATTRQTLKAVELQRQGYSHGAIARMLGISVADARRLV